MVFKKPLGMGQNFANREPEGIGGIVLRSNFGQLSCTQIKVKSVGDGAAPQTSGGVVEYKVALDRIQKQVVGHRNIGFFAQLTDTTIQ